MAGENGTPDTGQGANGAPDGGTSPNWQEQYEQLRPEYTRTTQELAQYRNSLSEYENLFEGLRSSDPQVQAETLAALGFEMDTGQPQGGSPDPDEFVDPLELTVEELKRELGEVRSQQEQEATAQQEAEVIALRDDYIGEAIGYIEQNLKAQDPTFKGFTEREETVLGNLAIAMEGEDGLPDVQNAYAELYGDEGVIPTVQQRYVQHKQTASAAPLGTTIPADKKPTTRRDRIAYIDERVRATEAQR